MIYNRVIIGASSVSEDQPIKSVIFDIEDNWTNSNYVGIRSIEFLNNSVLLPLTEDALQTYSYSAYATTDSGAGFTPEKAFNTTLNKIGTATANCWMSSLGNASNQRLIVVFDNAQVFNEIVINNFHNSGTQTDRGAQTVTVTSSTDSITDTTYNAAISNSTLINASDWSQHAGTDLIDDQQIWTSL